MRRAGGDDNGDGSGSGSVSTNSASSSSSWQSFTSTLTESYTVSPSAATFRSLKAYGLRKPALVWALRHHVRSTLAIIHKPFVLLCDAGAHVSQIINHINIIHYYYSVAHKRLRFIEASLHHHGATAISDQFQSRLQTRLYESDVVTKDNISYSVYKVFKSRLSRLLDDKYLQAPNNAAQKNPTAFAANEETKIIDKLTNLGFTNIIEDAISWTIIEYMDDLINRLIYKNKLYYKQRFIPVIKAWIQRIMELLNFNDKLLWTKKFQFHIHEQILQIYLDNILSLIKIYPQSVPSLHDLRECIHITDKKFYASQVLKSQFQTSLLVINCKTQDILQTYVSTIRTLRFLDPSGFILFHSSHPIIAYLRNRPDTIKCIVSGMTGNGDLYKELKRGNNNDKNVKKKKKSQRILHTDGNTPDENISTENNDFQLPFPLLDKIESEGKFDPAYMESTEDYDHDDDHDEYYPDDGEDDDDEDEDNESPLGQNYTESNNNSEDNLTGLDDIEDEENEDCLSIDGDYDIKQRINIDAYQTWQAEPVDAPLTKYERNSSSGNGSTGANSANEYMKGDAITILVNIYGSNEQIINEYKMLLSEKLVNQFDLNIQREQRILNLLTERFGKQAMYECTIMLKDIVDSNDFHSHTIKDKDVEAIIVSKEFWPNTLDNNNGSSSFTQLSDDITTHMDSIQNKYRKVKNPRKLIWFYTLGCIEIKLDFKNRPSVHAVVSPMQLSILTFLESNPVASLAQIRSQMEVQDESLLRRQITALVTMGILQTKIRKADDNDGNSNKTVIFYQAIEDEDGYDDNPPNNNNENNRNNSANSSTSVQHTDRSDGTIGTGSNSSNSKNVLIIHGKENTGQLDEEDEDDDIENSENGNGGSGRAASSSNCGANDQADEMAVYETYVIAMVTNLKQLSLEQIHGMLKRFVQTPVYDKSQTQLAELLNRLVEAGKVHVAAGIYRINKK